ncbi:MAG: hypothetical protein KGZ63_08655 [Clostridiales bacterium]|jgi:hypothetical protein|nr:hypothetical protein [Clostridiales bacterium]
MAFTIEFDDNRLIEEISDPYRRIHETQPLGMSFTDFLSLGENLRQSSHIYLRLADLDERIDHTSYTYVRMKEFVDLCIKDPSLYTMENFMFFLHLTGLSVPEHHLQYRFDPEKPVEDLVNPYLQISSFEAAVRGFAKSDKSKHAITSVYTCDGIEDVCMASLYHLLKLGLAIKVCGNCGKYFVPLRRSDALYCDRISPFNASKTCKEDGSQRAFEEKLKTDEAEKLRRQIYQAKQMRVRRNPHIPSYKENFERWKKDANQWKKDIKKGRRTSEEFIQWLEDNRK